MLQAYASKRKNDTTLARHRNFLRGSAAACAVIVVLSFAGEAYAEDEKWLGGDGNWSNANKWNGNAVPNGNVANPAVATPTVIGTGAAGTVTIDGPAEARNIQVGNGSTLKVINGGVLNTTPAVNTNAINTIGYSVLGSAPGIMLIDGTGSKWNAGIAGVRVGNGTAGTLTVSNGGLLSMMQGLLSVGLNASGNGTLNIDNGVVSDLEALRLGYNGATGTLNIINAGTLQTSMSSATLNTVGNGSGAAPATGIVNIAGTGSSWTIGPNGELSIGAFAGGTGTVNITNGGKLVFQDVSAIDVGYGGGTGHVVVDGNGSAITSAGGLRIANNPDTKGDVTVKNGGLITAETSVVVGRGANADGLEKAKLTIESGGSVYGKGNVSIAELGAKASATVTGGGSILKSDGIISIGADAGSQGTLTVADSAIVKGTEIFVGFSGGAATLNIGEGAKAGIIDGEIKRAGASSTINFKHNETNYVFSSAINDWTPGVEPLAGSVNFVGSGTTTLTAVSDYGADTNIDAGKLVIASTGSIANSEVNVHTGGTLSGRGTTGDVNVASGGAVTQAAGDTLHVNNITFADGSTFNVGINGTEVGSISAVDAALSGTVKVGVGSSSFSPTLRYTILNYSGTRTDQFDSIVATDLTFLKWGLDYSIDHQVDLKLERNSVALASTAKSANQRSVAAAVDGMTMANAAYVAVVQQNAVDAPKAFDALSGEVHASNQSAIVAASLIVSDTINDHVAASFDKAVKPLRYAAWAQGFGSWMNSGTDGNAAELDATTGGILSGFDVGIAPNWRIGVAGGYSQTDTSVDARGSSADTDSTYIAAYTGTRLGLFGLQLGAAYSWKDISSERHVAFPFFSETVRGDYNGDSTQMFGEVNYRYLDGTGITLLPFAGLSYINLQTDAFAETGGSSALAVAESEMNVTFSTVGLRGSAYLGKAYGATFTTRGTLAWRHAYGDTNTSIVAALDSSAPFTVGGVPIAEDSAFAELGLDVNVLPNMSVGITWAGQFGNDVTEDQLKGQLLYRW